MCGRGSLRDDDRPRLHPESCARCLADRSGAAARLRAVHHRGHHRRPAHWGPPLGCQGRRAGCHLRRRPVGRAVRPHRRSALPRHHRLAEVLRRGRRRSGRGPAHLGRRPGHLGCGRARRRRCVDCMPPPGHSVAGLRRRHRAGNHSRAGDRPTGELLQPGALRPRDHAAVGLGNLRATQRCRCAGQPERGVDGRARHDRAPHVPLRVVVEPADFRGAHPHRPAVAHRPRQALRDVCRRLLPRPVLDRADAR